MKPLPKIPASEPLPDEVVARLVDFVSRKFYPGRPAAFNKDKKVLMQWVILWPAGWLRKRGVSLPTQRYEDLLISTKKDRHGNSGILVDALRFGDFSAIKYLPAYLRSVIERHFAHHGDEIYAEAKAIRLVTESVMLSLPPEARERPKDSDDLAKFLKALKGKKPVQTLPSPRAKQKELF